MENESVIVLLSAADAAAGLNPRSAIGKGLTLRSRFLLAQRSSLIVRYKIIIATFLITVQFKTFIFC